MIEQAIEKEYQRQLANIELIASENYVSGDVLKACGSILTNKYAEGYPGRRYYGGCVHVDEVEEIAVARAKELFGCEHANVQPHSGSQANMGVYMALLEPQDTVLGMDYEVRRDDETIDYEDVRKKALECKPKLIVVGASAYPRIIDFARFREIADEVGAYLMADMAHIAGLVAAGLHPSPVPYCDFVTTTTHKTLRGPRGGMILCKEKYANLLDKKIFPGIQGGPLMHVIAAKAVCLCEALRPEFKEYQKQVIKNSQVMAETLKAESFRLVSGGTDNHLCLVDVKSSLNLSGKQAEKLLDEVGITCNKNTIPFDLEKPFVTSGIRLGSAAMTTRGFKEDEFKQVALWISEVLKHPNDEAYRKKIQAEVWKLTAEYPLPSDH